MDGKHPKKYTRTTPCGFGITPTGKLQYPFAWKGDCVAPGVNGYGGDIPTVGDFCYFDPSPFLSRHTVGEVIAHEILGGSDPAMASMLRVRTLAGQTHSVRCGANLAFGNFPWRVAKLSDTEYRELDRLLDHPDEIDRTALAVAAPPARRTGPPKLSSADHAAAIVSDVLTQDRLFEAMHAARPGLSDLAELRAMAVAQIAGSGKCWTRCWRRSAPDGSTERGFMIDGLWDFVAVTRERAGHIAAIEYYHDTLAHPAALADASGLRPDATPFLVSPL